MFLQSEVDRSRHTTLKVLLIILTAILVTVVLYIVIKAGREDVAVPTSVQSMRDEEGSSAISVEELRQKLDLLSEQSEEATPVATPSSENLAKQLDALSETPGKEAIQQPSPEDIAKKLEALSIKS